MRNFIDASVVREYFHYDPLIGVFTRIKPIPGVKNGSIAGSKVQRGYLAIAVKGVAYRAHRLAWLYVYGKWPDGVIDHINGNPADNRIANLRDVPQAINIQNAYCVKANSVTGYRGVSKSGYGKFRAQLIVDGVRHYLGVYETPQEAADAYMAAKKRLHIGCSHMA